MLVLSRKERESIVIGENITITVLDVRGGRVKLGIDAPTRISIQRQEIAPLRSGALAERSVPSKRPPLEFVTA
ncbi:MAG: carbon storage regulator [Planctomycetaceae bacterium]